MNNVDESGPRLSVEVLLGNVSEEQPSPKKEEEEEKKKEKKEKEKEKEKKKAELIKAAQTILSLASKLYP